VKPPASPASVPILSVDDLKEDLTVFIDDSSWLLSRQSHKGAYRAPRRK